MASLKNSGNLGNPAQFSCGELKVDLKKPSPDFWESTPDPGVGVPVELACMRVSLTVRSGRITH